MPRVLLIEDNPGDARLISELLAEADNLSREHHITHVERVSDAVSLLSRPNDIDIILSDITLPDSEGMGTLKSLSQTASHLPVLFMTGTNDEALAIAAMQQGAQDYLVKGRHDGDALARAIQYAIERKKYQNAAEQAQARVKLLAAQKAQLIALNRSKDEFVSIASHQLRTPATAVKQYVGMIVEGYVGEVDPKHLELLQAAYDSNERQLTVINELLNTARIDAHGYKLDLEPADLAKLVAATIANLKPMTDLRHQTIDYTFTEPCLVHADSGELSLVIENLIENASKYSPHRTTITVRLTTDASKAHLAVTDQGVGIAPQNQKVIFDKFTRVDNDLSDTVSGTGLGLYWAKRIIRLHKGTIRVHSELGKGSTFRISLPL